jgi:hypothetical protein
MRCKSLGGCARLDLLLSGFVDPKMSCFLRCRHSRDQIPLVRGIGIARPLISWRGPLISSGLRAHFRGEKPRVLPKSGHAKGSDTFSPMLTGVNGHPARPMRKMYLKTLIRVVYGKCAREDMRIRLQHPGSISTTQE